MHIEGSEGGWVDPDCLRPEARVEGSRAGTLVSARPIDRRPSSMLTPVCLALRG
jgi:hypothetical protein